MGAWVRGAVLVGVALMAVGCGGDSDPKVATAVTGGATSTTSVSVAPGDDVAAYLDGMRAWVNCLRDKGIDVTDPDPLGQVTFPGDPAVQKADPKFVQAQEQCAALQPPVPESILEQRKPKLTPEQIETQRRYAECMQTHGAPDFPDPGPDGYPPRDQPWDQTAPGARQATRDCAKIIGDPETPPTTQG